MISPKTAPSTRAMRILEGVLVALVAPGLAVAIGMLASLENRPGPAALFILAVAVATYVGGMWAGLLAAAVSFTADDYFFVNSEGFFVNDASEIVALSAFVVTVLFVAFALEHGRRASSLLRAERRLQEALEQTDTGTWEWAIDSGEIRWSENLGPIHGLGRGGQPTSYEEFLGLIHEADRSRVGAAVERAISAGKDFEIEVRTVHPDGEVRWISAQASVMVDDSERPTRIVGLTRDITARKRNEERQRFLARANEVLFASMDHGRAIAEVARLALPALGDWCAVDLVEDDGSLSEVAVAHADPLKVGLAHELRERFPPDPGAATGAPHVIRTGKAELYPQVPDELLGGSTRSEEYLELARGLGLRSAMVAPLSLGRETIGAVSVGTSESARRYNQQDFELLQELGRRMAIAVDNARLHHAERQARREVEEGAHQVEGLQALTARLSAAVLPAQIADIVVREGSESLGAVAGWVSIISADGEYLERLAAFGYGQDFAKRYQRIRLDAPLAVAEVARTGEPLWLESTEGNLQHELSEAEDATGGRALAVVPLTSGDRPFGFMALRFADARAFSESDRRLLETVARQCADALRRSQLFELEQRSRRELRRVQEITAALSAVAGVEEVAEAVLENALRVLDGRAAVLALLDASGDTLEIVRSKGYDGVPGVPDRIPIDSPVAVARAARSGQTVVLESLEERAAAYPQSDAVREATGPGPVVAVPILLGAHAIGAFGFGLAEARTLSDAERSFLDSLSRQAGQAVERARLYEAERDTREDLERLQHVTAALSAAASVEQIADAVVDEGLGALGATTGVFGVVDGDELILIRRTGYEGAPFPERLRIDDDWPITDAARTGQPIVLETLAERKARYTVPDDVWAKAGSGVLVAVPVHVGDNVVAAFGYTLERPGVLEARHQLFVEAVTVLASQALERAGLYEREQMARREAERGAETLRTLQGIAEIGLAARSLEELLDPLLTFLRDAVGGDQAVLLFRDPDRGDLFVQAAVGIDESEFEGIRIPWGEGVAGRIAASARPLILDDVLAAQPISPFLRRRGGSLVGVPLRRGPETIGVLHVGSDREAAFGEPHVALLELAAERAALALERTTLFEREHEVAVTLQRSVLPEDIPRPSGATIAVRYVPGSSGLEVGGDWYDVIELDSGLLGLAVGDVVGKGVAAAATMAQLRNALRVYALEGLRPASVLARLNRLVEQTGASFATLLYATVDPDTLICRYACAGHPPAVLVRAADGSASLLEGGRSVPLGVQGDPPYRQDAVGLEPGDLLLLYTDGLVERRDTPLDERLEQLVQQAAAAPRDPEQLLDRLLAVLGDDPGDDVALLAYRPAPQEARLELRLPSHPSSLARVRSELRTWLARGAVGDADAHEIVLACSEACANAIEHAQRPERSEIEVKAETDGTEIRITVRDFGGWLDPPAPGERGLGLRLMRETMDDVEVDPNSDGAGTAVHLRRQLRPRVPV